MVPSFKSSRVPRTTTSEPRGTSRHPRKNRAEPIRNEEPDKEETRSVCTDLGTYSPGGGTWANMAVTWVKFRRLSAGQGAAGLQARTQSSVTGAGSCRLFADPEFADSTFGVVPAFTPEFCTVFLPTAVGFPLVPIFHEAAKMAQTVSLHPTVLPCF